jgi:hypothetical protein
MNFSKKDLKSLKKALAKAEERGASEFIFGTFGIMDTGYAKYLIQYLEQQFNES